MTDDYATIWFDTGRKEGVLYGGQSICLRYEFEFDISPGDIVDLADLNGDRFGIANIDFITKTPIYRLPMLPIEGMPDFGNADEAITYFENDNRDADIQSSDVVTVIGLFNTRPV